MSGQLFGGGFPGVKSIQVGTIALNENSLTATATITAVDTANTILLFNGYVWNSAGSGWSAYNPAQILIAIDLTNSTTVTATRDGTYGGAVLGTTVRFTVLEFYPGIFKSIQQGKTVVGAGATTGTTTVAAVNTAKSVLLDTGNMRTAVAAATDLRAHFTDVVLTNSTTVTASRTLSDAALTSTHHWMLLEFY